MDKIKNEFIYDGVDPDKRYKAINSFDFENIINRLKLTDLMTLDRSFLIQHLNESILYLIGCIIEVEEKEYRTVAYMHYLIVNKLYDLVKIAWSLMAQICRCDTCFNNVKTVQINFQKCIGLYNAGCRYKGKKFHLSLDIKSIVSFYKEFKKLYKKFYKEVEKQLEAVDNYRRDIQVRNIKCETNSLYFDIKNVFNQSLHGSKLILKFHEGLKDNQIHLDKELLSRQIHCKHVYKMKGEDSEEVICRMIIDDDLESINL